MPSFDSRDSIDGPQLTPEQKAQSEVNLAQTKAAVDDAKTVAVHGKTFRVAHVTERNQAPVDLVGTPVPYFAADIEAAARAATRCQGRFAPDVLAFLGGDITTADLGELNTKISGKFRGWSVSLMC